MAGLVVGGAVLGGAAVELWRRDRLPAPTTAQTGAPPADLQRLNMLVPSQSHAMIDVGYHWTNLWFAAEQKNWRLAEFYFNEARSHMQWTILIRPIRKDDQNRDVDLQAIFDALDVSSFAGVKMAIAQKDSAKFAPHTSWRSTAATRVIKRRRCRSSVRRCRRRRRKGSSTSRQSRRNQSGIWN